jgi:hypothetical protein
VVPRPPTTRSPQSILPLGTGLVLPQQARKARGGRTTRLEYRGLSGNNPSWLYTRRCAICQSLRAAHATYYAPPPVQLQARTGPQRYRLTADTTHASWSSSMATQFRPLLGTDHVGTTVISLLISSPSTYANYDNALRHYFAFCVADGRSPYMSPPLLWFATLPGSAYLAP